jgi:hypothetical protein
MTILRTFSSSVAAHPITCSSKNATSAKSESIEPWCRRYHTFWWVSAANPVHTTLSGDVVHIEENFEKDICHRVCDDLRFHPQLRFRFYLNDGTAAGSCFRRAGQYPPSEVTFGRARAAPESRSASIRPASRISIAPATSCPLWCAARCCASRSATCCIQRCHEAPRCY